MRRAITAALGLGLVGGLLGLTGCTTPPDVIPVTTTADVLAGDGLTSLREAFVLANRNPNDSRIEVVNGATYELTNCADGALKHATASTLSVTGGATIHQTCADTRVLVSTRPVSALHLLGMHVVGGPNSGVTMLGAGIRVLGSLQLEATDVTGVDAGPGGSVVEGSALSPAAVDISLRNSLIDGNDGTGIRLRDGGVSLDNSGVHGNTGDGVRLLGTSTYVSGYGDLSGNAGWGLNVRGTGGSDIALLGTNLVSGNGGGGILCFGCRRLNLDDTVILDNGASAPAGGGGGVAFVAVQTDVNVPTLTMHQTAVSGNRARRSGGGVFVGLAPSSSVGASGPSVSIEGVVRGNRSAGSGHHGGGIAVTAGDLSLYNSDIRGNVAGGAGSDGGGVYVAAADTSTDVTVNRSTFANNIATRRGGGLAANGVRRLEVTNSTVSGNTAPRGGGIAVADDPPGGAEAIFLHFSTVAANSAPVGANVASEVRLETYAALLALPQGGGTSCTVDPGDRFPGGYSFVSDVSCGVHPSDVISAADPQLGPLTAGVRVPAPTSPVAGMVPVAACDLPTDQRDMIRPQGVACEPGSVEIAEAAAP